MSSTDDASGDQLTPYNRQRAQYIRERDELLEALNLKYKIEPEQPAQRSTPRKRKTPVQIDMTPTRKSPRTMKGRSQVTAKPSSLVAMVHIKEELEDDDEKPSASTDAGESLPANPKQVHHLKKNNSIFAGKEKRLLCLHPLDAEFKDRCDLLSRVFCPLEHGNEGSSGTQLVKTKAVPRTNAQLAKAKQFGQPGGLNVGDIFKNRVELHESSIHRGHQHGIFGDEGVGAYSVVVSNGYDDNEDQGSSFLFTGEGGLVRPKKGQQPTSRTARKSRAQTMTKGNAALLTSCSTGTPVRVVRGHKNKWPGSPKEGYRYDGLYQVTEVWEKCGQSTHGIFQFKFERLPGQPALMIPNDNDTDTTNTTNEDKPPASTEPRDSENVVNDA